MESNSTTFELPLENALIETSWETGIQVIVDARDGGTILQTKSLTNVLHPSADLIALTFNSEVTSPGEHAATFTDDRPTGASSHYAYDIYRETITPSTRTLVGKQTHGVPGAFQVTANHAQVVRSIQLPVIAGDQIFWITPCVTYKNTAGTTLGRHDISHKTPNLPITLP